MLPPRVRDRFLIEVGRLGADHPSPAGQKLFLTEYGVQLAERPAFDTIRPLVDAGCDRSKDWFRRFAAYSDYYAAISAHGVSPTEPSWVNDYLPPLDGAALYGFVASEQPRRYLEIGSGNSTRFVRRAVRDHGLDTTITSIDPHPRADIDEICDRAIRTTLEQADLSVFDELEPGDHVFFDGSHRAFQNSDVVVFFVEVLPKLPPGVLVGVHDIFLPWDYPDGYIDRFYSEQFVLGAYLLGDRGQVKVEMPMYAASGRVDLHSLIDEIRPGGWDDLTARRAWPWDDQRRPRGAGFWLRA